MHTNHLQHRRFLLSVIAATTCTAKSSAQKVLLDFASGDGQWRLESTFAPAANGLAVEIAQRIQEVTATTMSGRVLWSQLRGTTLAMADGASRWALRGEVTGNQWRGEAQRIGNCANTSSTPRVRFLAKRVV